jgi:hypothetical protein
VKNKHRTINRLLKQLKFQVNFKDLHVVDHWEADRCAIGLQKGNKLIYISTYNGVKHAKEEYDYDLEIGENLKDSSTVIKSVKGISNSQLIHEIKSYLEV